MAKPLFKKNVKPLSEQAAETRIKTHEWKVAIIDDDHDVVSVTQLVLKGLEVDGHPLLFLTAHSAEEGRRLFRENKDIAIAFVDVVMETDEAGLDLIRWIREDNRNHQTRLIIRTGQPGQAPEESVIRDFDINDYKNKTELTATRLKTTTYSAIRSYRDLRTIDEGRLGLVNVVNATSEVIMSQNFLAFGSAVIRQMATLLNLRNQSIYLAYTNENVLHDTEVMILAASDTRIDVCESLTSPEIPEKARNAIAEAMKTRESSYTTEEYIRYISTGEHSANILYVSPTQKLDANKKHLLDVFATNVALTFENISVKEDIQQTQKELMYIVGDAIEQRSKETGAHVRRVALICELLGRALGYEEEFVQIIKYAAPLHDIGKIGIPETILHKPGKLDPDEWAIMQTHAQIGYDLLRHSKRILAKIGASIAYHHHERWDGKGYPQGLAGEDIPIEGRLMAIADVIDALGSKRSYKEPWPAKDIIDLITKERGKHFDPTLVDKALELFDQIMEIRRKYPD